jgi:hypothetical protein
LAVPKVEAPSMSVHEIAPREFEKFHGTRSSCRDPQIPEIFFCIPHFKKFGEFLFFVLKSKSNQILKKKMQKTKETEKEKER